MKPKKSGWHDEEAVQGQVPELWQRSRARQRVKEVRIVTRLQNDLQTVAERVVPVHPVRRRRVVRVDHRVRAQVRLLLEEDPRRRRKVI